MQSETSVVIKALEDIASLDQVTATTMSDPAIRGWAYAAAEIARTALAAQPAQTATHCHKKRGTEYVLIGVGKMQAENWEEREYSGADNPVTGSSVDMRRVAIYRSIDDGTLWVRPLEEFEDGRFEAVTASKVERFNPSQGSIARCVECDGYNCDDGCAYPTPTKKNGGHDHA